MATGHLGALDGGGSRGPRSSVHAPRCKDAFVDVLLGKTLTTPRAALRAAMRGADLDGVLGRLSQEAHHADVRAIALAALLSGSFSWRVGSEWHWTDKVYGNGQRRAVLQSRPIAHDLDVVTLIRRGAKDKAPLVRRAAADGFIRHFREMPDALALAQAFATDCSAMVRWRGDYVLRQMNSQATAPST